MSIVKWLCTAEDGYFTLRFAKIICLSCFHGTSHALGIPNSDCFCLIFLSGIQVNLLSTTPGHWVSSNYFNHPDGNFRLCLRHPTNWQIMRTNLNSHNRTPWTLLALFEASCPCSWQARQREWPHSAWFLPPELWRTFWFSINFLRGVQWVGGSIWGTCQNRLWRGDLTLKNWIVYLFLIFLNLPKLYSYIILAVLSYACTTT